MYGGKLPQKSGLNASTASVLQVSGINIYIFFNCSEQKFNQDISIFKTTTFPFPDIGPTPMEEVLKLYHLEDSTQSSPFYTGVLNMLSPY